MAMLYPGADVTPHAAFILGSGLALGGLPESQQKVKSHTYRCGIWSIDTVQSSVQYSAARDRLMSKITDHTFAAKAFESYGDDIVVAYKLGIWHANFELSMQA